MACCRPTTACRTTSKRCIVPHLRRGRLLEFQPEYAPEMLCADARLEGRPVALIANRRGFLKTRGPAAHRRHRLYGIGAQGGVFRGNGRAAGPPLIYLQDVSGFMVGPEAERDGIIRAGAEMVETMSCATVPKIVLTLNHASGAGYYAMAGQGFDPNFTFGWPTARIGVMEGDSAVHGAVLRPELEKHKARASRCRKILQEAIERTRADYERWLDARYAAARGHVDAVIDPLDTRDTLAFALECCVAARGLALQAVFHDPHRQRAGILGRLAGSAGAAGGARAPSTTWRSTTWPRSPCRSCRSRSSAIRSSGYARDFPPLMARLARPAAGARMQSDRQCRRRESGGLRARSGAAGARAESRGGAGRRRASAASTSFWPKGHAMRDMDTGEPLSSIRRRILSANAYIGAFPLAEALATGADVVIAGRSTDTALALAPMIHRFGWGRGGLGQARRRHRRRPHHRVRRAMHRRQLPGGLARRSPTWPTSAIRSSKPSRTATLSVTKHPAPAAAVDATRSRNNCCTRLGDPENYITPDCVADFTSIRLEDAGPDRVRVTRHSRAAAPPSLKLSISYSERLEGDRNAGLQLAAGARKGAGGGPHRARAAGAARARVRRDLHGVLRGQRLPRVRRAAQSRSAGGAAAHRRARARSRRRWTASRAN